MLFFSSAYRYSASWMHQNRDTLHVTNRFTALSIWLGMCLVSTSLPAAQLQSLPSGLTLLATMHPHGAELEEVARANSPSLPGLRGKRFRWCTREVWCTAPAKDPLRRPAYRRNSQNTMTECRQVSCSISTHPVAAFLRIHSAICIQ